MTNHSYKELIVPVNRYVDNMPPSRKRLLALLESSLLLVLASSVVWYVN